MKFNPTWPQAAIIAVLFAAVILTHIFAPLAAGPVQSLVGTIVGALFFLHAQQPATPSYRASPTTDKPGGSPLPLPPSKEGAP